MIISALRGVVRAGAILALAAGVVAAQDVAPNSPTEKAGADSSGVGSNPDKRVFGVLPNYRTVDATIPFSPISTKRKFIIASKDTFDWPSYILAGAFAGISQMGDSSPSFGQGIKGYAHRYGVSVADQDLGNFMTEAIMPTLFHEDPRYFRKVTGSKKSRLLWAATRVLITKSDSGHSMFNFAEVLGNGTVASIGNAYYPDERGLKPTMQRMSTQIGTDALSQVMKEFWPDIKQKWFSKKSGQE